MENFTVYVERTYYVSDVISVEANTKEEAEADGPEFDGKTTE